MQALPSFASSVSKRILIALIVVVLCALGIAIWTMGEITRRLDAESEARSVKLVSAALRHEVEQLDEEVVDYAGWGAAYENLHVRVDATWAYDQNNFGPYLFETLGIGHVYVVDPLGRVTYAVEDGKLAKGNADLGPLAAQLQPLIAAARNTGPNQTKAVSGSIATKDGLNLFSAAALSTGSDPGVRTDGRTASIVVFGRTLGAARLRQIEQDAFVSNLRLAGGPDEAAGAASMTLRAPDGRELRLLWTPERPGDQLIASLAPTLAFASVALAILLLLTTRSALNAANQIETSAKQFELAFQDADRRSLHDATTELPNRAKLSRHLEASLAESGANHALLYIDVDHFKSINDAHGHPVGDEVLRCVAQTLLRSVRSGDLVARIGGDEFVLVMRWGKADEVEALCARLLKLTAEPVVCAGAEIALGLSIGVALAPQDAATGDDLLKLADVALYRAKAAGRRTFRFFSDHRQSDGRNGPAHATSGDASDVLLAR